MYRDQLTGSGLASRTSGTEISDWSSGGFPTTVRAPFPEPRSNTQAVSLR